MLGGVHKDNLAITACEYPFDVVSRGLRLGVAMAIFSHNIWFKRVDFPTSGSPIIATKPDLKKVV